MKTAGTLNRILVSSAACLAVAAGTLATPATAEAKPCGSAATVASDIWDKWGDVAAKAGCAAGTVAAGIDYSACYATVSKYTELVESMVSWWNKQADNSWATIGPRKIEVGDQPLSGTLQIGGTRLFCTPSPVREDRVQVRITKDGGKAKTDVQICKMKKDGSATEEYDYTWDKGKDNIGETESRTVTSTKDKVLCVYLNNKSALKKFSYKIDAIEK